MSFSFSFIINHFSGLLQRFPNAGVSFGFTLTKAFLGRAAIEPGLERFYISPVGTHLERQSLAHNGEPWWKRIVSGTTVRSIYIYTHFILELITFRFSYLCGWKTQPWLSTWMIQ